MRTQQLRLGDKWEWVEAFQIEKWQLMKWGECTLY
jgi:hypothetical protein